jgi:uncharacterized repeat protein (TIGR03803 family)
MLMRSKKFSIGLTALLAIVTVTLFMTATRAVAQQETVLYNFGVTYTDADVPFAGLVFDAQGNLFGTTFDGGAHGFGAVFELVPQAGGGWKEKLLHSFNTTGNGGFEPFAGLVMDAAGNLYGTTLSGGAHGAGSVFELLPQAGGGWMGKGIHTFGANSEDGIGPEAGLVMDSAGNLYGTTHQGGYHGSGIAFELSPTSSGGWTEKLLHTFSSNANDGYAPTANLIFDAVGNLYGTTVLGGTLRVGTVFELMPAAGGHWTEKILHNFRGDSTDGGFPEGGVIFDAAGNLYSTTSAGGTNGAGTVFELTPTAGGRWTERVLHTFLADGTDGITPMANLVFDAASNLYGTTAGGGANGDGTVFELTPAGGGSWTETVLHNFSANGTDGVTPQAGFVFDAAGNLYGTTSQGGAHGGGIVFEITP